MNRVKENPMVTVIETNNNSGRSTLNVRDIGKSRRLGAFLLGFSSSGDSDIAGGAVAIVL